MVFAKLGKLVRLNRLTLTCGGIVRVLPSPLLGLARIPFSNDHLERHGGELEKLNLFVLSHPNQPRHLLHLNAKVDVETIRFEVTAQRNHPN